jgi:hypothetical protein
LTAFAWEFEVRSIGGFKRNLGEVDVVNGDFRHSSGDSVFVEIIVLLLSIELPFVIGSIIVKFVFTLILGIGLNQEVSPEHSASVAAITAEAAVISFREVQISFA